MHDDHIRRAPTPSVTAPSFGIQLDRIHFERCQIGNIVLVSKLGAGGSAPVWLGVDRNIKGHKVACKLFGADSKDRERIEEMRRQIERDAEPLAELEGNQNILRLKEIIPPFDGYIDSKDGFWPLESPPEDAEYLRPVTIIAMVTEFINRGNITGPSYRHYAKISNGRYLSELADVADALDQAHQNSRVHCDIKPSNIFWSVPTGHQGGSNPVSEGRLVLGDWGISYNLERSGFSLGNAFLGSLPYLAPEAFDANAVPSIQRDIYAFGCTLFELITGSKPFELSTEMVLPEDPVEQQRVIVQAYSKLQREAPRPHAFGRSGAIGISLALDRLINNMMHVTPSRRPKLAAVVEGLRKERERRRPPSETVESRHRLKSSAIPPTPVHVGLYKVARWFRTVYRKERAIFFFITLPERTSKIVKDLFEILIHFYADSFTCLEVFGKYDFVVKVWDSQDNPLAKSCCDALADHVVKKPEHIRVLQADEIYSSEGEGHSSHHEIDASAAAIALNELQMSADPKSEITAEERERLTDLLQKLGVIAEKASSPFHGTQIPCVTLIHGGFDSRSARQMSARIILQSIAIAPGKASAKADADDEHTITIPRAVRRSVVLYRAAPQPLDGYEREPAEFVVEYCAQSYGGVREVPGIILNKLDASQLQTWTLLSTKHIGIISDKVQF